MTLKIEHHQFIRDDEVSAKLDRILLALQTQEKTMAAIDDKITALQAEVARQTTVDASALTLIQGFGAQLAAAVAAAQANGATPAQLQELTDLQSAIAANDSGLATGVAANTPA